MRIIAFGFERRVGKDTAVKFALSHLRQFHNKLACERLSFGDQVKDVAYQMYKWAGLQEGINYENNPSQKELTLPRLGKSPREIWEELGAFGRSIHKETWIGMSLNTLDCDIALCSDMRDPFEAKSLRIFPSTLIKITSSRPGVPKGYTSLVEGLHDFDDWDYEITNDGTLKEYNQKIVGILKEILANGI